MSEVKRCRENESPICVQVILTNGYCLVGQLHSVETEVEPLLVENSPKWLPLKEGYLRLCNDNSTVGRDLAIPLAKVASIRAVVWMAEQIPEEEYGEYLYPMHEGFGDVTAFLSSLEIADKIDVPKMKNRFSDVAFSHIRKGKPYRWGRIVFDRFEPLYCDWEYLSRISGGVRSLGVSVPFGGFSIGGEPSLWSLFEKKLRQSKALLPSELSNCDSQSGDVSCKGTVSFFEKRIVHEMEDGQWELGALTRDWQDRRISLRDVEWVPVYLSTKGFMYPRELWDRIMSPFVLAGSIHKTSMRTYFGQKEFFLKVRLAAFLPD